MSGDQRPFRGVFGQNSKNSNKKKKKNKSKKNNQGVSQWHRRPEYEYPYGGFYPEDGGQGPPTAQFRMMYGPQQRNYPPRYAQVANKDQLLRDVFRQSDLSTRSSGNRGGTGYEYESQPRRGAMYPYWERDFQGEYRHRTQPISEYGSGGAYGYGHGGSPMAGANGNAFDTPSQRKNTSGAWDAQHCYMRGDQDMSKGLLRRDMYYAQDWDEDDDVVMQDASDDGYVERSAGRPHSRGYYNAYDNRSREYHQYQDYTPTCPPNPQNPSLPRPHPHRPSRSYQRHERPTASDSPYTPNPNKKDFTHVRYPPRNRVYGIRPSVTRQQVFRSSSIPDFGPRPRTHIPNHRTHQSSKSIYSFQNELNEIADRLRDLTIGDDGVRKERAYSRARAQPLRSSIHVRNVRLPEFQHVGNDPYGFEDGDYGNGGGPSYSTPSRPAVFDIVSRLRDRSNGNDNSSDGYGNLSDEHESGYEGQRTYAPDDFTTRDNDDEPEHSFYQNPFNGAYEDHNDDSWDRTSPTDSSFDLNDSDIICSRRYTRTPARPSSSSYSMTSDFQDPFRNDEGRKIDGSSQQQGSVGNTGKGHRYIPKKGAGAEPWDEEETDWVQSGQRGEQDRESEGEDELHVRFTHST